jgi:hypothetical protein
LFESENTEMKGAETDEEYIPGIQKQPARTTLVAKVGIREPNLERGFGPEGQGTQGAISFALPAGVSAIGASGAHKCNSLPSVHSSHDETCTAATRAVVGCFVPDNIVQRLQELKPMTKDIAVSHHCATCFQGHRQFDAQFGNLSHLQFDRQNRRQAGFTNVQSPTRQRAIL